MAINEAAALEVEAQALLAARRHDEARARYARLCELRPDYADGWLMLGALDGEMGRVDAAIGAVSRALELDPGYAEAHLTLAHLHKTRGDIPASLDAARRACESDSGYGEAWLFLGALQGGRGDYADAADSARKAVVLLPDSADAQANLGNALLQLGRCEEAESAYRRAHELMPEQADFTLGLANILVSLGPSIEALELLATLETDRPDYHTAVGNACLGVGRIEEALASFRKRLELTPGFALGRVHAGVALRRLGRLDEARQMLIGALAAGGVEAVLPLAHNMLGVIYLEEGGLDKALVEFRQALELNPDYVAALDNCGRTLELLGDYDQALDFYRRGTELVPGSAGMLGNQASVLQRLGQQEAAFRLLEPLLTPEKIVVRSAEVFARLCHAYGRCGEAIRLLESLLARPIEEHDRRTVLYALGRLYDRTGHYDRAFENYAAANRLKPFIYTAATYSGYVDQLITTFSADRMARLPRSDTVSDKPVFIVGMPRSGTSLVEQILASHPAVFGAGELTGIFDLVNSLPSLLDGRPYPLCVPYLMPPVAHAVAERYLRTIDALAPEARRVTDKMPHNFQHLGLIHMLFPGARIIHCTRDPLDTCLSCYFQEFGGHHPYAYDLANLGAHYRDYRRLMDHWKHSARIPMLEVKYEQLVSDQENLSRQLIEYCGLEWDERCLRFHETERTTRTASYDQVRKPIYTESLERWRHYEKYLEPLRQALAGL